MLESEEAFPALMAGLQRELEERKERLGIGPNGPETAEDVARMLATLQCDDEMDRILALGALAQVGAPEAFDLFADIVDNFEIQRFPFATIGLGHSHNARAVPMLLSALGRAEERAREDADAAGKPDVHGFRGLVFALACRGSIRDRVRFTLRTHRCIYIGGIANALAVQRDKSALPALRGYADDQDDHVRQVIARAIRVIETGELPAGQGA